MEEQPENYNTCELPGEEAGEDLVQFSEEEVYRVYGLASLEEAAEEDLTQLAEEVRGQSGLPAPEEEAEEDLVQHPEAGRRSLFQRLALQRVSYFADVEEGRDESESQKRAGIVHLLRPSGFADVEEGCDESESQKRAGIVRLLRPSGFADLAAWCRSSCAPVSPAPAPLEEAAKSPASIVEQPTLILPVLALAQSQIADLPTIPALTVAGNNLFTCGRKLGNRLIRLSRSLRQPWLVSLLQHLRQSGMPWRSLPERHAWLMERRQTYQQESDAASKPASPSSDERYARYVYLRRDRSID